MSRSMRRSIVSACATLMVPLALVACGGQSAPPTSPPATTVPATTAPVPTVLVAASPETASGETAAASPVSDLSPIASPVAPAATPIGSAASPVAASMATPVAGQARTAEECAGYLAWQSDPEVQANLEHVSLWPGIVAEAEKAAAGEAFDTAAMTEVFAQIKETARGLRTSDDEFTTGGMGRVAGRAMGLASRVAGDMAEGGTQEEIASELTDLKAAITDYEAAVAAANEQCGVTA